MSDINADQKVVGLLRCAVFDVFGGNCTFADDDIARLKNFALRAVLAETERDQALAALKVAREALTHAATELQETWGAEEGDDPIILDALAAIGALSITPGGEKHGGEG